jgi:hypothetical protein
VMTQFPKMIVAGLREEGTICRRCQREICEKDPTTICPACGGIHHWECWGQGEGCSAYECAPGNRSLDSNTESVLRITGDELAHAGPIVPARPVVTGWMPTPARDPVSTATKKWNRLAIAALIVAILGIPLFGIVTGLIAIVLGCLALSGHTPTWKGAAMAVAGIVLGILDVAGWTIGLLMVLDVPTFQVSAVDRFDPDPKAMKELPGPINRAMKSNVLIQTSADLKHLRGGGIGSGVIVRIKDKLAWIVTNRHVADPGFTGDEPAGKNSKPQPSRLVIKSVGQPATPAQLVWVAPHGIDLALVTMPVTSQEIQQAVWAAEPNITVGNNVFAIGNPHGLGWTYSPGGISQMRLQTKGPLEVRVIQTSAAINPGNSGGGLYNENGHLVGINTWTQDKRFAEGLSFSISFHTLLPLLPAEYALPVQQLENDTP